MRVAFELYRASRGIAHGGRSALGKVARAISFGKDHLAAIGELQRPAISIPCDLRIEELGSSLLVPVDRVGETGARRYSRIVNRPFVLQIEVEVSIRVAG